MKFLRIWNEINHVGKLRRRFPDAIFAEGCIVRGIDRFFPSKHSFLDIRAYLNCSGGAWSDGRGFIRIGENSEVGPYSVLWGAGGITIGNNVHIGAHVTIAAHEAAPVPPHSTDFRAALEMRYAPVVIGDHVLIGSGVRMLPGVHIGHHVVIGVGSIVTKDIPSYSVAYGNPARIVKTYLPEGEGVLIS